MSAWRYSTTQSTKPLRRPSSSIPSAWEADSEPTTVFDIPTLNAIGARLFGHADAITNAAADLRLAARIADRERRPAQIRCDPVALLEDQRMCAPQAATRLL
jgi:hypothetical protein